MVAALDPLHNLLILWHIVGLDYLLHMHVRNIFDSVMIAVDQLTQVSYFCHAQKLLANETTTLFLHGVNILHGLPRVIAC
jgi:hypothetical protein